jgi:hypothetical protein
MGVWVGGWGVGVGGGMASKIVLDMIYILFSLFLLLSIQVCTSLTVGVWVGGWV